MPAKKNQKQKKASVQREINYSKHYATNLIAGGTKYDFRFELFSEKLKVVDSNEWTYISDALVILTPQAAKKLHSYLEKYLKSYEKEHGKIEDPDLIDPNFDVTTG